MTHPMRAKAFNINHLETLEKIEETIRGNQDAADKLGAILDSFKTHEIQFDKNSSLKVDAPTPCADALKLLHYLTLKIQPELTMDTGFHSGLAATSILLAHDELPERGGHVSIAPNIKTINAGIGAQILEKFGFENFQLMNHAVNIVLPQMLINHIGRNVELAFLNGSISFTEALIELYYTHKLSSPYCMTLYHLGENLSARHQAFQAFQAQFSNEIRVRQLDDISEELSSYVLIQKNVPEGSSALNQSQRLH